MQTSSCRDGYIGYVPIPQRAPFSSHPFPVAHEGSLSRNFEFGRPQLSRRRRSRYGEKEGMARPRKKNKAQKAQKARKLRSARKRQAGARVHPLTELSAGGSNVAEETTKVLFPDHVETATDEADMKENVSPQSVYVTAVEGVATVASAFADQGNTATSALASTDRSQDGGRVMESPLTGFSEQLASLSVSPVMRRVYSVSPTRSTKSRAQRKKALPRIEIEKRGLSSTEELKALIQMRRLLDDYVAVDRVHEVVVGDSDENADPNAAAPAETTFPRLLIDGMDIGGLDQVIELEAGGILQQMVKSASFTKGFVDAGPSLEPPGNREKLKEASKTACTAVEELRRSLDCVERKILERSKVAEVISNTPSGASMPVRLCRSWDVTNGQSFSSCKRRGCGGTTALSLGEWEWPSTHALLTQTIAMETPEAQETKENARSPLRVKDAIKYLSSEAKSGFDIFVDDLLEKEEENEEGIEMLEITAAAPPTQDSLPTGAKAEVEEVPRGTTEPETRKGFAWKHFFLGVAVAPAVVLVATKGVAPVVCAATRVLGRTLRGRRKLQSLVDPDLLGPPPPVSVSSGTRARPHEPKSPLSLAARLLGFGSEIHKRVQSAAQVTSEMAARVASSVLTSAGLRRESERASRYVCVEAGDSLWTIASEVLGDERWWRRIADQNQIAFPFKVVPGECLELPSDHHVEIPGMG